MCCVFEFVMLYVIVGVFVLLCYMYIDFDGIVIDGIFYYRAFVEWVFENKLICFIDDCWELMCNLMCRLCDKLSMFFNDLDDGVFGYVFDRKRRKDEDEFFVEKVVVERKMDDVCV